MNNYNTMMIFIIILLSFIQIIFTQSCDNQLHTFYETLGLLPITPVQPVFSITTGVSFGVPFVTITFNILAVAKNYQTLPNTVAPIPNVAYVSMDLPYCYSNIQTNCAIATIFGIERIGEPVVPLCNLDDRDATLGDSIAGRLFIYSDQSLACQGIPSVTIYNVTYSGVNSSDYTYDLYGIRTGNLSSEDISISSYRTEACNFSNGNITNNDTDTEFACQGPTLQCNQSRPVNTQIITPVTLRLQYQCYGFSEPGSSQFALYRVINPAQPIPGIEMDYDLAFFGLPFTNSSQSLPGDIIVNNTIVPTTDYLRQLILPSTLRQYLIAYPTLNFIANMSYGAVNPSLNTIINQPGVTDPTIPAATLILIPCRCNFSIACNPDGSLNDSQNGTVYYTNNTPPVAIGETTTPIVAFNSTVFLQNNGSFDPDMFPNPFLTYYWIPIAMFILTDLGNLTDNSNSFINAGIINDNTLLSGNASFQTFPFLQGIYSVALIVSDGQDMNISAIINITAVNPQPILNPKDQTVFLQVGTPGIIVFLNASVIDPLNSTLNASWTQSGGYVVQIINNNTLFASFNATLPGTYIFNVIISNNVSSISGDFVVNVIQTTGPPIASNYTNAPTILPSNRTNPPNFSGVPTIPVISEPPSSNTNSPNTFSPSPIPSYPPVFPPMPDGLNTSAQRIFAWTFVGVLFGVAITGLLWGFFWSIYGKKYHYIVPNRYLKTHQD